MARIDPLIKEFLALNKIAVVGVSNKRETGCNMNYRKFKENGYRVFAINPHIDTFEGEPCYPDLKSIPEKPDGVFLLANQLVTEKIVQECVELEIKHVWMHCMMGTKPGLVQGMSSVSQKAVKVCRDNDITVIPGTCPNQFLKPDFGHEMMRRLWRTFGFLNVK